MRGGARPRDGRKPRAAPLYAIIAFKLVKGLLLLSLALGVYTLVGDDLADRFERLVRWVRMDPERQFFSDLGARVAMITPANVRWVATGTLFYSLFSVVESIGLMMRARWASWLAIGESAFFIPIEVYKLVHMFSFVVLAILAVNVWIVIYLYRNSDRLFRH